MKSWLDNPAGLYTDVPVLKGGVRIGSTNMPLAEIHVQDLISDGFALPDGSPLNYSKAIYGAGTAYTITATQAAVVMGTTSPVLVLDKAGIYRISARAQVRLAGATFAASRTVTVKLRRTNNTALDLPNGSGSIITGTTTTATVEGGSVIIPEVIYTTANINDSITLFAGIDTIPSAGSIQIVSASIIATRIG